MQTRTKVVQLREISCDEMDEGERYSRYNSDSSLFTVGHTFDSKFGWTDLTRAAS